MKIKDVLPLLWRPFRLLWLGLLLCTGSSYADGADNSCKIGADIGNNKTLKRIVKVNMVALNQPFWYNRLGASQLHGMIFALAGDVIYNGTNTFTGQDGTTNQPLSYADGSKLLKQLQSGATGDYTPLVDNVTMRNDKRPRPIVLRANVHDCLDIHFTNLLVPAPQELTSYAGVHIQGTEVFSTILNNPDAIKNDGAFIGKNTNNLAGAGEQKDYSLFIRKPGTFVLYSAADDFSNFFAGQMTFGLFGSLNVQPKGSEYYRSQVSEAAMLAATKKKNNGNPKRTKTGQPLIDYQAIYPATDTTPEKPVLNMLQSVDGADKTFELVYTDPTAIITGPNAGQFKKKTRPYGDAPQYPQPLEPYREFNIMYHEPVRAEQAFTSFTNTGGPTSATNTFAAGGDFFAINYGMAGIGPEIYSNRINVGPMYDCATCAYEEFFLSSWSVGDPAMVVDIPANFCSDNNNISNATDVAVTNPPNCVPSQGAKATKAFYPDDPSNVYHSYMNDHVKMRIHHGAGTLHHLHHLHAHQWLHSPNSDDSHYLDSQLIGPGSSFTLDMVYNGSGNRNQTVGDSIFHCHFYPHFAEGMWSMWRVHDVFEKGTKLDADGSGTPENGSRAYPDAEILKGTPIPGLVPMPTIAMAPMPGEVHIEDGQIVLPEITIKKNKKNRYVGHYADGPKKGKKYRNPGYPFFIPGIAGERAPHPPLDFAQIDNKELNGGLPRHVVSRPGIEFTYPDNPVDPNNPRNPTAVSFKNYDPETVEYHNKFDFSKFSHVLNGLQLPEDGTNVEKVAMGTHATRTRWSTTPANKRKQFVLNGLLQQPGAPFADPCSTDSGSEFLETPTVTPPEKLRSYRGVDMEMDVVLNKKGWHYSQQRFGVLWQDLIPTLTRERPPEPLFFRANSGDCVNYWFSNVIPEYYELDDFQVRTPTDVLGQHIHLVKFDVTSSDGGANGWNYEDGTFSPETVVERIKNFNKGALLDENGNKVNLTVQAPTWLCEGYIDGSAHEKECISRAENEWMGAQTTVQRWYADPQLNDQGKDRTLRTVFTHDHFSPSTHQQAGLYMGLLIEPEGSTWQNSETGEQLNTRTDGGPTTWAAIINTPNPTQDSYREFVLEFQDFQLAYTKDGLRPQPCVEDSYGNLPPMCYPKANEEAPYNFEGSTTVDIAAGDQVQQTVQILTSTTSTVNNVIDRVADTAIPAGTNVGCIKKSGDTGASCTDYSSQINALCTQDLVTCVNTAKDGTNTDYVSALRSYANNYSGYLAPDYAINPPQGQTGLVQTPTLISTTPPFALGTYSVNYRNDPLPLRVWDPATTATTQAQTSGAKGDLAYVYNSIERADADLNTQAAPGTATAAGVTPALTAGVYKYDPYTPLLRAYQGDKVQVRTLVGAHINMHNFSMQGFRWLFEPSYGASGYRSNQPMGISEHFEMLFNVPVSTVSNTDLAYAGEATQLTGAPDCKYGNMAKAGFADYLYNPSSEENGLLNGNWGLVRAYQQDQEDLCLQRLPSNQTPKVVKTAPAVCKPGAPQRSYNVVSVTAAQLPDKQVVYNERARINDDSALLYFGCDIGAEGASCTHDNLLANLPKQSAAKHIEPFVLRAAAGECITVNLANKFKTSGSGNSFPAATTISDINAQNALLQFRYTSATDVAGQGCTPYKCTASNPSSCIAYQLSSGTYDLTQRDSPPNEWRCNMTLAPSEQVALAPQLVSYDINKDNGVNLGFNNNQSADVGSTHTYTWYAGITTDNADGSRSYTPAEFGTANLLTADPIKQTRYGMLAGMIIEPAGSCWSSQDGSKTTCSDGMNQAAAPVVVAADVSQSDSLTGIRATVYVPKNPKKPKKRTYFRENVLMFQDQLAFSQFTNTTNYGVERMAGKDTNVNSGQVSSGVVQGRGRYRDTVATDKETSGGSNNIGQEDSYVLDMACAFSNNLGSAYPNSPNGIALGNPESTIYYADPGDPVRFRVMQPHGADQHVFELFGHIWQEEPYNNDSTVIKHNKDSQWQGSRMGVSAADRFEVVLPSAGGKFASPGDYLYRSYPGGDQNYGMWGIFRVGNQPVAYADGIRPLVCVPQAKPGGVDLQYIYSQDSFADEGYALPANCDLVPNTFPNMVKCAP